MNDDRTEPPTYKRRMKARQNGQVARSNELVSSAVLFGALGALPSLAPRMNEQVIAFWNSTMLAASHGAADPAKLEDLTRRSLAQVAMVAGPVLGLVAGGALASNVAQVGLRFNPSLLQPKLSRLDPLAGLRRFFSPRAAVELLKGFTKLAIVTTSGWQYISEHRQRVAELAITNPTSIGSAIAGLAHDLGMRMAATLAVVAALDYAYQRWQFEKSLRMTKQEVKEEMKEAEGNPEIKARIRQRQREIARRRMMAEVPKASLVITNPTHFAVALKYEMGQKGAPKVVAKGQDLLALKIRELAEAHRVPTVENPPLARQLHKLVDVGQEIPPALYRAVAEVLSLIWRLENSRRPAVSASRRPA